MRCWSCYSLDRAAAHGTKSKYDLGCRCDACTEANREHNRALRERGGSPPSHGYSGYVNYRCRCLVCTAAAAAYWQQRRRAGLVRE